MTLEEIVAGLRSSNDAAVELVSGLDEDQWRRVTVGEGWPVGVAARHIALGHRQFVGWVDRMVAGRPVDPGDIDAVNARHALAGIVATPDEVAHLLRVEGDAAVAALTSLSPEDVAGEVDFGGGRRPRIALLGASVRHVDVHLASIRASVEAEELR
jgi:DinB family protein